MEEAFKEIVEHSTCKGVKISESNRVTVPTDDATQFYQALADNLITKLFTIASSRLGNKNVDANEALYNKYANDLQVPFQDN